jgi:hypothetical protein
MRANSTAIKAICLANARWIDGNEESVSITQMLPASKRVNQFQLHKYCQPQSGLISLFSTGAIYLNTVH